MSISFFPNKTLANDMTGAIFRGLKAPGVQYLALGPEKTIFEYYGGLADIKNHISMKASTTMMAYSMTKTFTAAAILRMVEKGLIGLDDSMAKFLPDHPYGAQITIRQLLSHTSGIPNPLPLRWVHPIEQHYEFNENAALAKVLNEYPIVSFEPGRKFGYSNIGYWLLGKIIEAASGQDYASFMREYIFAPLNMEEQEMSFTIPDKAVHSKGYLAKYSPMNLFKHFLIDQGLVCTYEDNWLHIRNHYVNGPAFGGIIGTARGISKFLQDQLRSKSVLFGDNIRGLFYSQQETTSGHLLSTTLGWHIGQLGQIRYFYKEGGGGGYHCEMRIYPLHKIASVIMANETGSGSHSYLSRIDRILLGADSDPAK